MEKALSNRLSPKIALSTLILAIVAVAVTALFIINKHAAAVVILILIAGLAVIVVIRTHLRHSKESGVLFNPLVGPLSYLVYALLVPQVYMAATGHGITSIPYSTLTWATIFIMCIAVIAFMGGAWLARRVYQSPRANALFTPLSLLPSHRDLVRGYTISAIGRGVIFAALLAKIVQVVNDGTIFTKVYGTNQLDYDLTTAIAVAGESLIAVGSLLIMFGNSARKRPPLLMPDWILLGTTLLVSLVLLGSRGEIIAPVVLFLWFWLTSGRKVPRLPVLGALVLLAVTLVAVGALRSSTSAVGGYPLVQQILVYTSSPQLVTANVAALVPGTADFYFGSTYTSALMYMLPGFLSRAIFGEISGTGAFAYRDLIGFTDPNQGYGFALPAEAYLNFGFLGVALVFAVLGYILAVFFSRGSQRGLFHLRYFVYPLVISYFPYGLRSDFLGQLKSTIYPLIIIAIVLGIVNFATVKLNPQERRGVLRKNYARN